MERCLRFTLSLLLVALCIRGTSAGETPTCTLGNEPRRLAAHVGAGRFLSCRDNAIVKGCAARTPTRGCACTLAQELVAMPRSEPNAAAAAAAAAVCSAPTAVRLKDLGIHLLVLAGHRSSFTAVREFEAVIAAAALCEAALQVDAGALDAAHCAAYARRLLASGPADWDASAAHRRFIVAAARPYPANDAGEEAARNRRELHLRTPWLSFSAVGGGSGYYSPLRTANSGKLRHDAAQLRHLVALGILAAAEFEPTAAEFDALARAIDDGSVAPVPPDTVDHTAALGGSVVAAQAPIPAEYERVRATYGRTVHSEPLFALRGEARALHPSWDGTAVEEHFASASTTGGVPVAVIDNFLSNDALQQLLRFCKRSTVWHNPMHGAYLGAYESTGFTGGLIYQIAEELRARVPHILGDYPLDYAWAYLYLNGSKGIRYHADIAAFTANFWITPDDANLDVGGSGMVISEVAAPQEWDATRATSNVLGEQLLWNSSDASGEVHVHGLSEVPVHSVGQALALVRRALRGRAVRSTDMNTRSSRSHAVLQLLIEQAPHASAAPLRADAHDEL
jgi:hypothetical protein